MAMDGKLAVLKTAGSQGDCAYPSMVLESIADMANIRNKEMGQPGYQITQKLVLHCAFHNRGFQHMSSKLVLESRLSDC
jgi:hypothetical protein